MFMGFSLKKLVCGVKGVQARCERDGSSDQKRTFWWGRERVSVKSDKGYRVNIILLQKPNCLARGPEREREKKKG